MTLPRYYLLHAPDGPPPGLYVASLWNSQRLLQARSEDGALYIFLGPEVASPAGWYTIEEEERNSDV